MKLAPTHLKRYKDVAMLFLRHGNNEIAKHGDFLEPVEGESGSMADASEHAADLEKLAPFLSRSDSSFPPMPQGSPHLAKIGVQMALCNAPGHRGH